jgi:hypothetical protein
MELPFALTTKWHSHPKCPYYHLVPKDMEGNLRWRRKLLELGSRDPSAARDLWRMCARDILFFVNSFCFTYDPRRKPSRIPFITWAFQDDGIMELQETCGVSNLRVTKSRDMGVSWITLLSIDHPWRFVPGQSFLCGSRKEEYVDKSGDPKTLFWKLDFINNNLPHWLRPRIVRNKLSIHNEDNGSTIDGESTNKDFARGDSRTRIFLDEFAAVENQREVLAAVYDATDSAVAVSTHQGTATEFFHLPWRTVELHWSLHPRKARGLYRITDSGSIDLVDKEYWTEEARAAYKFISERPRNKRYPFRSPWYDAQCEERKHAVLIAQELDIDPEGSAYQFFDGAALDRHERDYCLLPFEVGDLDYERGTHENGRFAEVAGGPLRLWIKLDGKGRPPRGSYVCGADISAGTGASNSCLAVVDRQTGEKVAEYVNSRVDPAELASIAVAMCKWFNDAYLVWEANGPGRIFGGRVIALGYGRVFYRKNERSITKKVTEYPGWHSTPDDKTELLGEYRRVLTSGEFVNRSREAIAECRSYVVAQNGVPCHSAALDDSDPTGARHNHGDRVIADALCVRGMKEVSPRKVEEDRNFPAGSFGWRREQRRRERNLHGYVLSG